MKRKHIARSIAVLLLLALVITSLILSLSACGGGSDNGTDVADGGETVADTAAEETTTANPLAVYKDLDFKGADYNIIAQHVENEQPTVPPPELTGEKVLDALYERDKTVSEMMNINIVYTNEKYNEVGSRGKLNADLQAAITAGDCPWHHVITSMADGMNNHSVGGFITNLWNVDNIRLEEPWWNQYLTENLTYNGKLFAQSGPITLAYYYSPCALAYNRTVAENNGLGDFYDDVADGTWTFDRFAGVIKDISRDLDGDGKMTTEDFYAVMTDELSAQAFYVGIGGRHDAIVDGRPKLVLGEEANITRLAKVAEYIGNPDITLGSEGLQGFTSFAVRKTNQFKIGKTLFCAYNMNGFISQLRDMEDDYGLIPNPKLDEQQDEYRTLGSGFGPVGVAIPITVVDTSMPGAVMDAMAYISYTEVGTLMFEVTLKEKIARDENSKLMLDIIYEDVIYDWTNTFSIGNVHVLTRAICLGKKPNIASEWAAIADSANAALDKILEAYDKIN